MTGAYHWLAVLLGNSPTGEYVLCGLAGLLGALVNATLEGRPLVLPRMKGNELHLGFIGNLIICVTVAFIVDGSFQMAFFAALTGTYILRHLKAKLERAFAEEIDSLNSEE